MSTLNADAITTLTFDCHGTLIGYEAGTIAALRPLLDRHGIALSEDAIISACQEIEARSASFPIGPTETSWPRWWTGSGTGLVSR